MDEPAVYRIRIGERLGLGPDWSGRLASLRVTTCGATDRAGFTDLLGTIQDQAVLMGVLEQLYGMGVTLISIERLAEDK